MNFISEFIDSIGERMSTNEGVYWGSWELMKPYDGWHDYIKAMFDNLGFIEIFLIVASALLWTGVYLITIYRNHQDKSPSMPWVALCLNFSWEFQFAFMVPYPEPITRWGIYLWVVFDLIMYVQDVKYGRKMFSKIMPGYEVLYMPVKIGLFGMLFMLVLFTNAQWPAMPDAPMFAAYLMNTVMSFLFITHMFKKEKTEGLSIWIAWCKFLGTVAPTILGFMWMPGQWFVYGLAIICAVLDATYIVLLTKRFHSFGLNPYTRKPLAGKEPTEEKVAVTK
ncbi:MAG: hypothetical protein RR911_04930 [Oscillospiraceae bacterium]